LKFNPQKILGDEKLPNLFVLIVGRENKKGSWEFVLEGLTTEGVKIEKCHDLYQIKQDCTS